MNHPKVGTPADHAFKSLRSDAIINLGNLFDFSHLVVVRTLDMGSPGAIDVLAPLKLVQIHTFYQLSSLPFKLLEKSNRRLLIGFLLLPVLFYFEVHQAANKFPIKDINLLSKKSTKLMTALGRVVFLTLFCDSKCSKMTPVKNSLSCSRFNLAELQILLLLMKASIKSSRTSWRCSYFIS